MAKKDRSDHHNDASPRPEQMTQGGLESWAERQPYQLFPSEQLPDCEPMVPALEDLQALHSTARHFLMPHLARSELDLISLEKLVGRVERQGQEVRQLRTRLADTQASETIKAEVADFSDFLEDSLLRLRYQSQQRWSKATQPKIEAENDRALSRMVGLAVLVGLLLWATLAWFLWP